MVDSFPNASRSKLLNRPGSLSKSLRDFVQRRESNRETLPTYPIWNGDDPSEEK